MTMQCRDVREVLDSYLSQELLVETNHSVLRHLEGCPECRAELDTRSRVRSALKRAVRSAADLQMRPEFAADVSARLRTQPARASRPWMTRWLPIAASLLLAAGGALYFLGGPAAPQSARDAVGDHQNCALQFRLSEKPVSLDEGAARFDPVFAQLKTVPPDEVATASGPLRIADRHVCLFAGHRWGHVVFKSGDHAVSLLMPAREGGTVADADLAFLSPVDGLSVASFSTAGHSAFIVSDLPDTAFQQAARAIAQPMRSLAAALRNILTTTGD